MLDAVECLEFHANVASLAAKLDSIKTTLEHVRATSHWLQERVSYLRPSELKSVIGNGIKSIQRKFQYIYILRQGGLSLIHI